MSSSNAIDYFATLGRAPGPFVCKQLESEEGSGKKDLHPSKIWGDAITDIAFVMEDESCPEEQGWDVLRQSLDGREMNPPHLAVRRRRSSGRLDHIVQIKLIHPGDSLPRGYEVVERSISGVHSAFLNPLGFLAVRRADGSAASFLNGEQSIDDLVLVLLYHEEEIPENYVKAERAPTPKPQAELSLSQTLLTGGGGQQQQQQQKEEEAVCIAYHHRPAMGLCDLRYEAKTLDRYPDKDNKELPLPAQELPLFAFPHDLRIQYATSNRFPLPVFFTFVFTDAFGKHLYAACMRFYEKVPHADVEEVFAQVFGSDKTIKMQAGTEIFCPKVICVVSSKPFYRAMRRFLRQLYSLSLSSLPRPLEHFIASLVSQVPLPVEGGRPFHVLLDAALISSTSRAMAPIIFDLPKQKFFPHMDLDFAGPLRCLSVDNLLALFTLLLFESKIVFLCYSNTMLTETMETLRYLLFPLTWSSSFISRLPDALLGMLQAPGGFMIGIHTEKDPKSDAIAASIAAGKSRAGGAKKKATLREWSHNMIAGTYVVDLSFNSISQYDGTSEEQLSMVQTMSLVNTLPAGPRRRLQKRLESISAEYAIGPQTSGLEQFDSAFDLQTEDEKVSSKKWESFPTLGLRDSFMAMMVDVLGDYPKFIIPPSEDISADTYRTFQETFAIEEYLAEADPNQRPLLEKMLETQMFSVLLQQRSEGTNQSLAFFESASEKMRNYDLCIGGHGKKTSSRSANDEELPVPIYKLVEAAARWNASTGKEKDQLLLQQSKLNEYAEKKKSSTFSLSSPLSGGGKGKTGPAAVMFQNCLSALRKLDEIEAIMSVEEGEDELASRQRDELDRGNDLHLQDASYGPLILPGPLPSREEASGSSSSSSSSSSRSADFSAAEDGRFSYREGWPDLQSSLLQGAQSSVHERVKLIRDIRVFSLDQTNPCVRLLTRPEARRFSFCHSGQLFCENSTSSLPPNVTAAIFSLLDVVSLSAISLVTRTLSHSKPTSDLLQILGLLSQIENLGLLDFLDETVWRSLLLACANIGGNLMRKISCVVYEQLQSCGIRPDSLTFGQYNRALGAIKQNTEEEEKNVHLDQFLYLEEMGLTWFIQRSALTESVGGSSSSGYSGPKRRSSSSAGSSFDLGKDRSSSMSLLRDTLLGSSNSSGGGGGGGEKASVGRNEAAMTRERADSALRLQVKTTGAAILVSNQLNLRTSFLAGALSFVKPVDLVWTSPPRRAELFTCSSKSKLLDPLAANISDRIKGIHQDAIPHSPRPKTPVFVSRLSNDSTTSTTTFAPPPAGEAVPKKEGMMRKTISLMKRTSNAGLSVLSAPLSPFMSSRKTRAVSEEAVSADTATAAEAAPASMAQQQQQQQEQEQEPEEEKKPAKTSWTRRISSAVKSGLSVNVFSTPSVEAPTFWAEGVDSRGNTPTAANSTSPIPAPQVVMMGEAIKEEEMGEEGGEEEEEVAQEQKQEAELHPESAQHLREKEERASSPISSSGSDCSASPSTSNKNTPQSGFVNVFSDDEGSGSEEEEERLEAAEGKSESTRVVGGSLSPVSSPFIAQHKEKKSANNDTTFASSSSSPAMPQGKTNLLLDLEPESVSADIHEETPFASIATATAVPGTDSSERDSSSSFNSSASIPPPPPPSSSSSSSSSSPPSSPQLSAPKVSVLSLQEAVLRSFVAESRLRGTVVAIHSRTPCASCGFALLEEEVHAVWAGLGHHRLNAHETSKDLLAAHRIVCPVCKIETTPQLHVKCYTKRTNSGSSSLMEMDTLWSMDVCLLSPYGLRFVQEEVLALVGELSVDPSWLLEFRPELYWGMLWYSARMAIPTGTLSLSTTWPPAELDKPFPWDGPVVVAWREQVAKAKAKNLIQEVEDSSDDLDSSPKPLFTAIDLYDIYPGISLDDIRAISFLIGQMDGSPATTRVALLGLSKISPLVLSGAGGIEIPPAAASTEPFQFRNLYILFITLVHLYQPANVVSGASFPSSSSSSTSAASFDGSGGGGSEGASVLARLLNGAPFDKVYVESIKCIFEAPDFEQLNTSQQIMLDSVASLAAQTYRAGFGFFL